MGSTSLAGTVTHSHLLPEPLAAQIRHPYARMETLGLMPVMLWAELVEQEAWAGTSTGRLGTVGMVETEATAALEPAALAEKGLQEAHAATCLGSEETAETEVMVVTARVAKEEGEVGVEIQGSQPESVETAETVG